jgi:hypothetical protein
MKKHSSWATLIQDLETFPSPTSCILLSSILKMFTKIRKNKQIQHIRKTARLPTQLVDYDIYFKITYRKSNRVQQATFPVFCRPLTEFI